MKLALAIAIAALLAPRAQPAQSTMPARTSTEPLVIGETFAIPSSILGEQRRINVYLPAGYASADSARYPVLYMPDGGMAEDFLHVAGLIQVSAGNGTMRPFILVGIENTERRRDMTGPTSMESDRRIAPHVGGSGPFRAFIRDELMPQVRARYRTTSETAIVGESLAGLFVVETFLTEPALFDTYIAIDPSLWWNDHQLVRDAGTLLRAHDVAGRTLYLASSRDAGLAELRAFTSDLKDAEPRGLRWFHDPMPAETHATIYHPAAVRAFRTVFAPAQR
jgi:uncharacterized protein